MQIQQMLKDNLQLLEDIRKEKIKLQTANIERNRIDRSEARQEMYYEYIGSICETLPLPTFQELSSSNIEQDETEYLCCISDLHYGACFISENNSYSPEIFKNRLEFLKSELKKFIKSNRLDKINIVCLGDTLQGCIRMSDLKINDSSVVKSTVDVSRLIAMFLNSLSEVVNINYYHVPTANHTQIRPLGTKASEIADEDLEYVISNYIRDLCRDNPRIDIKLAECGKPYVKIDILKYDIFAMHGHSLKNITNAVRDFAAWTSQPVDYLICGHFHDNKTTQAYEVCNYDCELLVAPSFVGSDPFADSLMKGSKAATVIYGFSPTYGHTETKKIILN